MVSHYNFQILLLGQTLVTELRSVEKYRKELRLPNAERPTKMRWWQLHQRESAVWSHIKVRRLITNNTNLQWARPVQFCILLNNQSMASRHQVQLDPTWQQSSIKRRSESNRPDNRKRYPLAQMVNSTPQAELTATEILMRDKQMTLGTCRHVRH